MGIPCIPACLAIADERALYWLAGFIEGEGCFTTGNYQGKLKIIVSSCDKDMLDRCVVVTGFGKVYGPRKQRKKTHSLQYAWEVGRQEECRELMRALYPIMGSRRRQRMVELLPELDGIMVL